MTTANSAPVSITLTTNNHAQGWQQGKTIQIATDSIAIYLPQDATYRLRKIQMAARKIEKLDIEHALLSGDGWDEASQWAFALGFSCVDKLENISFCGEPALIERLNNKLAVYAWSRDLTNQTPAELYPLKLAELTTDYITNLAPTHVATRLIQGEELLEQQWMGIYNVGKGSVNQPCLLEVDFNPTTDANAQVAACLVGKGITFDSGGYSIKSSAGMFDMKCDMGGAAVVAGALALAIKQGLDQRVKLYLCCAENMISNDAYKLGDIITYKDGQTVEIVNTDAEGRLVLADGLIYAGEVNAPLIIDAATLTGAAQVAVGTEYNALFSVDDTLAQSALKIADEQRELLWRLPLNQWHKDNCPSAFADTANSRPQKGGGAGGASNAAGFLLRFAPNNGAGWLHFDIAGAYHGSANGMWPAGATALGFRTIAATLLK